MAEMSVVTATDNKMQLFAGLGAAGLALGAFFWLWAEHGAEVYLGYLAGAAFTCL